MTPHAARVRSPALTLASSLALGSISGTQRDRPSINRWPQHHAVQISSKSVGALSCTGPSACRCASSDGRTCCASTTGGLLVAEAPPERAHSTASTPTSNPQRLARARARGSALAATRPPASAAAVEKPPWKPLSERPTVGTSPPGGWEAARFDSSVAGTRCAASTPRGKVRGHASGPKTAPPLAVPAPARPLI